MKSNLSDVQWESGVSVGPKKTKRGHAYNPSVWGARSGSAILHLAKELTVTMPAFWKYCDMVSHYVGSTVGQSIVTLRWWQKLWGDFVGLQIVLDLGHEHIELYNQNLACESGPGATSALYSFFPELPLLEGMQRNRTDRFPSTPLCGVVARSVAHRGCCEQFAICMQSLAVAAFWASRNRIFLL